MRKFEKGKPKTGWRLKGTPNHATAEIRLLADKIVGSLAAKVWRQLKLRAEQGTLEPSTLALLPAYRYGLRPQPPELLMSTNDPRGSPTPSGRRWPRSSSSSSPTRIRAALIMPPNTPKADLPMEGSHEHTPAAHAENALSALATERLQEDTRHRGEARVALASMENT